MLRSFHGTLSLDVTHRKTTLTGPSAPASGRTSWRTVAAPRIIWDALRDGLAAYRRYEHLMSRGIPHDPAAREALGLSLSRTTRETA
jgi:hypothetical protein